MVASKAQNDQAMTDIESSSACALRDHRPWPGVSWLRPVPALLGIFCTLHILRLSGYFLSIDDEFTSMRQSFEIWVEQGRWGMYLFQRFVLPQAAVPFLPMFLFGLFTSAAYVPFLRALGVVRLRPAHYLAFPLFCTSPVWSMLSYFAANIAGAGLGVLFVSLAAWYCRRAMCAAAAGRPAWPYLVAASVVGAAATSLYQSFALDLAACGMLAAVAHALQEEERGCRFLRHAAFVISILVAALGIYWAVQLLFVRTLGMASATYASQFIHLQPLREWPWDVLCIALRHAAQVYTGDEEVYAQTAGAVAMVIALGVGALVLSHRPMGLRFLLLGAAVVTLALPFLPDLLNAGAMPPRTLVAVPALIGFFAVLGMTSRHAWLSTLTAFFCILATLQTLSGAAAMHAAGELARKHDEALAAQLHERILRLVPQASADHPVPVDIYGARKFRSVFPRPTWSSAGYSFFEWDGGNEMRMLTYMRLLGYDDITMATLDLRGSLQAVMRGMPPWPAEGSVRVYDGVVLVRFGLEPGWPFNQH